MGTQRGGESVVVLLKISQASETLHQEESSPDVVLSASTGEAFRTHQYFHIYLSSRKNPLFKLNGLFVIFDASFLAFYCEN